MTEIYKTMVERARVNRFTTYGEVAEWLGKPEEVRTIDRYFIEIDEHFKENGQPPLSTLLVNVGGICGDGYFSYHFAHDKRDKLEIWSEQVARLDLNKAMELISN